MFYDILSIAIKKYIPFRRPKGQKYPPWFNLKLIKMLNIKNKIRKRYLKYKNPLDAIELKLISKRCDNLATICYNSYTKKIEDELTKNTQFF